MLRKENLQLARPDKLKIIIKDWLGEDVKIKSNAIHLEKAISWLCQAQDDSDDGGVSAGYDMKFGWRPPYFETTGYIIKSFVEFSKYAEDVNCLNRAKKMGDWVVDNQLDSGAIKGGVGLYGNPIVFNTGQVILGLCSLFQSTKNEKYIKSAIKAADWLINIQDSDGKWSRYVYNEIPHAYHSEVAWSILEVYKLTTNIKYLRSAKKNIIWVLSLVETNGWFNQAGFQKNMLPSTHTIGYTLQGLLESAEFFNEDLKESIQQTVRKTGENLLLKYERRKRKGPNSHPDLLNASFDRNWKSKDNYSCMTGNCQIAIVWINLYNIFNDVRFLNASLKLVDSVKSKQMLNSRNNGINGGIPGSYPIWGKYKPFSYPNWAAKYFIDVIILQEKSLTSIENQMQL